MSTYEVLEIVQADPIQPKAPWWPRILTVVGAAVITYWAVTKDHEELLENSYRLLESLVKGPPEKASPLERRRALRQIRAMEGKGELEPRLSDAARDLALRVTTLNLPEFIEGIRVGTPSRVPGVPPIGAVLPIAEVLPKEEWLGGKTLTRDPETGMVPIGDFEVATPEDLKAMIKGLEVQFDVLYEAVVGDGSIQIKFEEYIEDKYQMSSEHLEEETGIDTTEMMDEFREFIGDNMQEFMMEMFWELPEDEKIPGFPDHKMELFYTTEFDRYGTTHHSLAVINTKTNRTYQIEDIYDLFRSAIVDSVPFNEDDMAYSTMYLWHAVPTETRIDKEIKRALSQYLSNSMLPGEYARIQRLWWMGEAGCEAYECYRPPRTIMDPNLQIMKGEGDTEEVNECPADPDAYTGYYLDYCWVFSKSLELATSSDMTGETWGGSPWFVDICGIHVKVDGDYYTIPADNMLEYMMGQYNVPKYLEGLVCAAFAVVTPEMQREIEHEVEPELGIFTEKQVLDMEMPLLMDMVEGEIFKSPLFDYAIFTDIYKNDGWEAAWDWVKSDVLEGRKEGTYIRSLDGQSVHWDIPNGDGFDIAWEQGLNVGRGRYAIMYKPLTRYLLDLAAGRSRRTITYELA